MSFEKVEGITCPKCGSDKDIHSLEGLSEAFQYKCVSCGEYISKNRLAMMEKEKQSQENHEHPKRKVKSTYEKEIIHKDVCAGLTELYKQKDEEYGGSYAKIRQEYPDTICIRLQGKVNRLKSLMAENQDNSVPEEKIESKLLDIANYAIMEIVERRIDKEQTNE